MYEWESKFIDVVLNRGRMLLLNHKVADLKETEKGFTAAVLTRERIEVSARKTDSGVWRMSCRCPASRAGRNCEHMAALMYAVEAAKEAKESGVKDEELLEKWKKMDEELRQEEARAEEEKKQKKRQREERKRQQEEQKNQQEEKKRQREERKRQQEEQKRQRAEKQAEKLRREEEKKAEAERKEKEAEEKRKEAEEQKRLEEQRAARRLAREQRKAEQARKKEEQKRLAEEAARIEYEKRAAEEARREKIRQEKAEEARRRAEKRQRELEEQELRRKQEEQRRIAEEKKRAEEEKRRIAREKKEKEEELRLKEEMKKREQEKLLEEENRRREAEKRKNDYTILGGSWDEDGDQEENSGFVHAEQKLVDYRYFNGSAISNSVKISPNITAEGKKYCSQGKVVLKKIWSGFDGRSSERKGQMDAFGYEQKREFPIRILFNRTKVLSFQCQCKNCRNDYYALYDPSKTKCPYKAGALSMLENYLKEHNIGDATDADGNWLLSAFETKRTNTVMAHADGKAESLRLVPRLIRKDGTLTVSFKVGESKLFVIKKLDTFCENVRNSSNDVYGTSTEFNHAPENFTDEGRRWIRFISKIVREESEFQHRLYASRYYYGREKASVGSSLEVYGWRLDEFYESLGDGAIEFEDKDSGIKKQMLTCAENNPKLSIRISEDMIPGNQEFHGIKVEGRFPELFYGTDAAYYISDGHLNRAEQAFLEKAEPLANMAENDCFSFHVGRNRISEFYLRVFPQLQEIAEIKETQPEKFRSYVLPEAHYIFYLDMVEEDAVCRIYAVYGDRECSVVEGVGRGRAGNTEPFRDMHKEEEILYYANMWFPEIVWEEDELRCGKDEETIYRLMKQGTEHLMELGEVRCTKRFLGYHSVNKVKVTVGVSLSAGLLELNVSTEDVPAAELLDILKSYRRKQKYYRLKNGSFVDLEEPSLEMLAELTEAMNLKDKDLLKGKMKLPVYRTLYLDKLLEEHDSVTSSRDSHFKEVVKGFKTVKDADFEEPASLSRQMRRYQKDGYKWLRTLEAWQFGGILADDMGLGKTLQVIAVMLAAKEEGREGTSLVVTPASLVFNWGAEFEKFAPQLKFTLITGNQEERQKKISDYQQYDVLVTSYDLLKRDIAFYEDKEFSYEVIDEAQYIKNHTTAAAKAVKVIKSRTRYALTGTPIENRLSELWSIFDYLMPGFLYGYDVFRKEIETPIVRNNDEKAMQRLQKMTGPFILRRLKENVLKDLPEKLEEYRYVRLGDTQQKLYDGQVVHMKEMLARQNSEDFNKNKLKVLAELTRLRQICCDPSLCFENYKGETSKLEACLDLIQSAMDGGHRILVFSQFTSMLEILQRELKGLDIPYFVITGSTSKEQRLELVKEFNGGAVPVFLISLKAGGVGLNLTGADVVIHYDPWWNLAAQNQATDRAHRIGQTKKVMVYKLIARQTIEEKIQKLQEKKKDLADQVISGEGGNLGSMSKEELMELLEV